MKVALFFGSFNPIHIGHLIIANHLASSTDLEQIWFVVSPHNPLKNKSSLLDDTQRLQMVRIAVEDNPKFKASNIEFSLQQPSYTVNTLAHLKEKYPEHQFSLILGEDNLRNFHKWKNYQYILDNYHLFIYPRLKMEEEEFSKELGAEEEVIYKHQNIHFCTDTPIMKISSSFIREQIKRGKDARYLLSEVVWNYVDEMRFYK